MQDDNPQEGQAPVVDGGQEPATPPVEPPAEGGDAPAPTEAPVEGSDKPGGW